MRRVWPQFSKLGVFMPNLRRFVAKCALVVCSAVSLAGAVNAASITNGDFETPVVTNGSFDVYAVGGSFTGWNVIGIPGNNVAIIDGVNFAGGSVHAESGNQELDLTGTTGGIGSAGIQQTIATVSGQFYQLSFWVGTTPIANSGTSTVLVQINGGPLVPFTNATPAITNSVWQQFSTIFQASSTSTTLAFINGDCCDSSNGLDNITIADAIGSTPLPAALPLFAGGLGVIGLLARRRKQKNVNA